MNSLAARRNGSVLPIRNLAYVLRSSFPATVPPAASQLLARRLFSRLGHRFASCRQHLHPPQLGSELLRRAPLSAMSIPSAAAPTSHSRRTTSRGGRSHQCYYSRLQLTGTDAPRHGPP
jgi:hypothetical protein